MDINDLDKLIRENIFHASLIVSSIINPGTKQERHNKCALLIWAAIKDLRFSMDRGRNSKYNKVYKPIALEVHKSVNITHIFPPSVSRIKSKRYYFNIILEEVSDQEELLLRISQPEKYIDVANALVHINNCDLISDINITVDAVKLNSIQGNVIIANSLLFGGEE